MNVRSVHKKDILESFARQFQLHLLILEDIANTDQQPKLDDYDAYLFLVMKMLSVTNRRDIVVEQESLAFGRNFVLSFRKTGPTSAHRCEIGFVEVRDACGRPAPIIGTMRWSTRSSINLRESTEVFFHDVYDHAVQIVDTIEMLLDMVSTSLNIIYLSSISYRLDAAMKVSTT